MTIVVLLQSAEEPDPWQPPEGSNRKKSVKGALGKVISSRTHQVVGTGDHEGQGSSGG